jgi:hypothetical protein
MAMSVGERDKKLSDMASVPAEAFCDEHTPVSATDVHIRNDPEKYLDYTTPYLTVRNLQFLKADSKWIKAFAIITGVLTLVLAMLTVVLVMYAYRLDMVIHRLSDSPAVPQTEVEPSPPTPSASPSPAP